MPTAPGFADVSIELTQTGLTRPAYITFGINPVSTDLTVIADQVRLAYSGAGALNSVMDSTVTTTAIRVSLGTDGTEDLAYVLALTLGGGAASSTTLPPNCALLVHKQTSRGGRRGRGRMFVPWVVKEADCDEAGVIASSPLAIIQNALNAFKAGLVTQTVPMYLFHGPGNTTPGAPTAVDFLIADRLISTQRRRLGR